MSKLKKQPQIYNINTFSFYRRQIRPGDLDRAFIKLIEDEEEKRMKLEKGTSNEKEPLNQDNKTVNKENKENQNEDNNQENTGGDEENKAKPSKNLNLNLIFPKISIERIMKIRDLFLEFDADRNRTFDQDEIYVMFNMNKIPITKEEVVELFGFNKKKQFLSFFEFIQLTVNEAFSNKFKKLIMEKIRYRTKDTDICPNDFSDMLSHLCEFGKLSPELKDKTREGQMDYITSIEKKYTHREEHPEEMNGRDNYKRRSTKKRSIISQIVQGLSRSNVNIKHIDFMNEKDVNQIRENPNLLKKEKEFKNFMEISNKKFLRFKEFLNKMNIRDKILKRKENVSQSLKTLNINKMKNGYLCYFPTENSIKDLKDNKIISYSVKKKKFKLPPIKHISTEKNLLSERKIERNMYFNNRYNKYNKNSLMKLMKNKNIMGNSQLKENEKSKEKSREKSKEKSKEEKMKEEEYASILASFTLNTPNLPPIEPLSNNKYSHYFNKKSKYSENTFVTTSLYSNLNQLQNQL